MTDKEQFIAMLVKAKIPYRDTPSELIPPSKLPEGCTEITTGAGWGDDDAYAPQPFDGGYGGFWQDHIFDADGNLLAIWGWE